MLWVLIRSTSNEYPQHIFFFFFWRNKKIVNIQASKSWLDKQILTIYLHVEK